MADNITVKDASGNPVVLRLKDVGAGVEAGLSIPADATGTIAWGTAGAANANVMSVQGIASGTALPISGSVSLTGATNNINNISGTVSLPTGAANAVAQASTTSGQTGTLMQGAVKFAAPTYVDGQTSPLSLDVAGNVRVSILSGTLSGLALETGGNLAKIATSSTNITAGAAAATTSLVVGTRYLSAAPTFTNGQEGALQIDANGKLLVAGTFSATPAVNSYTHIATATTTNGIKSGAGTLSRIVVNQTGTVASLISVFDNTTATGTTIAIIDGLTRTGNYDYELAFATGLSIITTGTAAPDITVVWR
jgi:hypothetical protein